MTAEQEVPTPELVETPDCVERRIPSNLRLRATGRAALMFLELAVLGISVLAKNKYNSEILSVGAYLLTALDSTRIDQQIHETLTAPTTET